ncbi:MAG: host attachment protein [bacterium]
MNKIVIAVDLGHFKAYKVTKNPMESARVELVENFDTIEGHEKLGQTLTDQAGSFGLSGGKTGVKGYGEPHNIELETEKRITKRIAKSINEIVSKEGYGAWYLAAPKTINSKIVEHLDHSVKAKLDKNISADLTKVSKSEIAGYFE